MLIHFCPVSKFILSHCTIVPSFRDRKLESSANFSEISWFASMGSRDSGSEFGFISLVLGDSLSPLFFLPWLLRAILAWPRIPVITWPHVPQLMLTNGMDENLGPRTHCPPFEVCLEQEASVHSSLPYQEGHFTLVEEVCQKLPVYFVWNFL